MGAQEHNLPWAQTLGDRGSARPPKQRTQRPRTGWPGPVNITRSKMFLTFYSWAADAALPGHWVGVRITRTTKGDTFLFQIINLNIQDGYL